MGAELSQGGRLIGAPRACRHVRAAEPRELHREVPHAARGARDEDATAEDEAALGEGVERGQPCHGKGRGLGERDLLGQLGEGVRGDGHVFGPGAFRKEPDHSRSRSRAGAGGGGTLDLSGDVPARAPAGGGHGRASDLAAIERDGPHAHHRFASIGHGLRHLADDEPARRFGIDDDGTIGSHGLPPV